MGHVKGHVYGTCEWVSSMGVGGKGVEVYVLSIEMDEKGGRTSPSGEEVWQAGCGDLDSTVLITMSLLPKSLCHVNVEFRVVVIQLPQFHYFKVTGACAHIRGNAGGTVTCCPVVCGKAT